MSLRFGFAHRGMARCLCVRPSVRLCVCVSRVIFCDFRPVTCRRISETVQDRVTVKGECELAKS